MPWCPKCKTEYIEGIELCADCNSVLIVSLDADSDKELTNEDLYRELQKHTRTYVKPEEQYKDTRSSGYMLTFIGAAGMLLLVLIALDVIPVSLDPFMKYIFFGVLGVLLLIFFVLGINALRKSAEYKSKISSDKEKGDMLISWLSSVEQKSQLDLCHSQGTSLEEAYFECQELMRRLILEKTPDITDAHLNYIIEQVYSQMYD